MSIINKYIYKYIKYKYINKYNYNWNILMLIDLNELSPKIQSVGNECHCSQSSGKVSEFKTPESQSQ